MNFPENELDKQEGDLSRRRHYTQTSRRQYIAFNSFNLFQRLRRQLAQQSQFIWLLIAFAFVIFFLLHIPSTNSIGNTINVVNYDDTTQLTDYALLDRLLTNQQNPAQKQFNRYDRTPDWVAKGKGSDKLAFSQQLALQLIQGHSLQQLDLLTQDVSLPPTASVTVIVHASGKHLQSQLQAIMSQSIQPSAVWVVCTVDSKKTVERTVSLSGVKDVQTIVRDGTGWIQVARLANTEYVWLVGDDVVPGARYLERVYTLAVLPEYEHALVGTEAALLPQGNATRTECLSNTQGVTRAVDMINDVWLLHRSWIPAVLKTSDQLQLQSVSDSVTGYFLSHTLLNEAGIPSILLPVDPHQPEYHGNTQNGASGAACKAIDRYIVTSNHQSITWRIKNLGDGSPPLPPVAFILDSAEHLDVFSSLICRFQQRKTSEVHVITTGEHRGLSSERLLNKLGCSGVAIHDLGVRFGPTAGLPSDETWSMSTEVLHGLSRQLSLIHPSILFYIQQHDGPVAKSVEVAAKMTDTVAIGLPARDVAQTLWMADLPVSSLAKWHVISIKLIITTSHPPPSLSRLVRSAARAHLLGDKVDVTLAMEQTNNRATQAFVNSMSWPHGDKTIRHRIAPVNPMPVFVESWYPTNDDDYAIMLDDNLEVSPNFYVWAKYALLRYRYASDVPKRTGAMLGVSLYSPRIIETDPKERQLFDATSALVLGGIKQRSAYLMQIPSGSGALFFPEHWREFHDYITARLADQTTDRLLSVTVPNSRSSQWVHSWRRYLDELVYMRGYVMLYPNVGQGSFSTNHLEVDPQLMSDYPKAAQLYHVPLLQDDSTLPALPHWDLLGVLDMWGKPETMKALVDRGLALHRQVSACPALPLGEHRHDPSDMLCPFARVVTVPVNGEDDIVPDLPTRAITLYVPAPTHTGLSDDS